MEDGEFVILVDYIGLAAEQMRDLRRRLREVSSSLYVAKNSFIRHAAEQLGWEGLATHLNGPTALISGRGDVAAVAKVLRACQKEYGRLAVKAGRADGRLLSATEVDAIADLPSRSVLIGQVVGAVAAPLQNLVGVLRHKIFSLLWVLKTIEERKREKG